MSSHYVTVVKVKMQPHPNAESLSVMSLEGGNVVVLRTSDWVEGELAAHIEPDYEVDVDFPPFAWLAVQNKTTGLPRKKWERVKPVKLRGIASYGLLIPLKDTGLDLTSIKEGDNIIDKLPVRRWEAVDVTTNGDNVPAPSGVIAPKYDIENYPKYVRYFTRGETIVATEKLHGANGRFLWTGTEFHCGSRSFWKKEDKDCLWWRALNNTPGLKDFLMSNPGVVVYGEVYGMNPGYKYGVSDAKDVKFAPFDLLLKTSHGPQWANWDVITETVAVFNAGRSEEKQLQWVPTVFHGPFDLETLKNYAEGPTLMPGNPGDIREGIVVKPVIERTFGGNSERVQVKFVSPEYLRRG